MVTDSHRANNLRSRTNIDMTANLYPCSNRDLLQNQAIRPNRGIGVDHDPNRMRQKQPAPQLAVDGDITARGDAPESMLEYIPSAEKSSEDSTAFLPLLIRAH